jgi:site-specific DNA recombinase
VVAQAQLREAGGRTQMAADDIAAVLTAMGGLMDVLRRADPADKATVYRHLGLKLTLKSVMTLT